MATTTATPPGTPARPGQRRPIPTWVYVVGAGGAFVAFYLWRRSQANAAAAAATAATVPPVAAGASYGNAADLSSLLPYLQAAGNPGTGQSGGTTFTPPAGEVQQGSGFWIPHSGAPVTDASGSQYVWIPNQAALNPYLQGGGIAYYQPTPGVFVPASQNGKLLGGITGGTPLYQMVT
jgi:hypothetical protein